MQASTVLMFRPCGFEFNEETAKDNEFMHRVDSPHAKAQAEFDSSVEILKQTGVKVLVIDQHQVDWLKAFKMPDAVFPNNWVFFVEGTAYVCGMHSESRRVETMLLATVLETLELNGTPAKAVRNIPVVCEGTGALVFDRKNRRVFINSSLRVSPAVVPYLEKIGFEVVLFNTKSSTGTEFYHTNVMLSIGYDFALVCAQAIVEKDRARVLDKLADKRTVIEVSMQATEKHFACNVLELVNDKGEKVMVMSESAREGLEEIATRLAKSHRLAVFPIPVIERVGGGSARCMVAEVL